MDLKIFNIEERLQVASILIKNGYTVRQKKEYTEGKRSYDRVLEIEEPKQDSLVSMRGE